MHTISLDSAMQLTGLSKRTLWRRVSFAPYPTRRESHAGSRTLIAIETIEADLPAPLEPGDDAIIAQADQGDAEAQNDVAMMLMEAERYDLAIHWLRLASEQEYPDAMHWLGRCYISGRGLDRDEAIGLDWIRRAAHKGHIISQRQVERLGHER
ncbi:tetratricopeptide repeat protein [Ectothiorhodospira marina]|uniref:Sel1 repeat-containing protein n=1 Tax=Ectothiorhodospira marina TaxID=1396821 RepID=A0A1H7RPC9_9GAMM|nr:tetratricopeptide repeat protein [Ectothiorhodospira marina]SEL61674.1 Sel1 repeat-containing protein [Ectothiorhodospira marina]